MTKECTIYVDEERPEDCRVNFDVNIYDRQEMRVLLEQYLRLLEAAAQDPELPIGTLLTRAVVKPFRWRFDPFYELTKTFYDRSLSLKLLWRPVKRWLSSNR